MLPWEEPFIHMIRQQKPLIHCITNYVSAGDVANILLALGASPVMADERQEAEEITGSSNALVLNLGTLNEARLEAMIAAGKKAASLSQPVVLDPVGAASSAFRKKAAARIIDEIPCGVIRGNASEILTIAGLPVSARGVDAGNADDNKKIDEDILKSLSRRTGAVIVVSGAIDLIADTNHVCRVKNGHPMMTRITGTGCMMSAVIAAFQAVDLAAAKDTYERTMCAVAAAGICGEMAYQKTMAADGGNGSFRMYYLDVMSKLTDDLVKGRANIEI